MVRIRRRTLLWLITPVVFFMLFVPLPGLENRGVCGEETGPNIIPSVELGGEEGPADITPEEVEEARDITTQRVYGLVALWIFIALCIFLISLQRKDDERLYGEGYYCKDIE